MFCCNIRSHKKGKVTVLFSPYFVIVAVDGWLLAKFQKNAVQVDI